MDGDGLGLCSRAIIGIHAVLDTDGCISLAGAWIGGCVANRAAGRAAQSHRVRVHAPGKSAAGW